MKKVFLFIVIFIGINSFAQNHVLNELSFKDCNNPQRFNTIKNNEDTERHFSTIMGSGSRTTSVTIPDPNFRAYLKTHIPNAFEGDMLNIAHPDVKNLTTIVVISKRISSLEGIQYFTGLTYLYCGRNLLTSLDLSKNVDLTYLDCGRNPLTSLDLSKNVDLTYLDCYDNLLTELDVSKNTALTKLRCSGNQLTSLDVSRNINLTELYCGFNLLTELDVSKNVNLTRFWCSDNQLTELDVTKNTYLESLNCPFNQITELDLSNNYLLDIGSVNAPRNITIKWFSSSSSKEKK